MTKYLVLKKIHDADEEPLGWRIVDSIVSASSPSGAIRKALATEGNEAEGDGDYVAVPMRSFAPVTVKVETKTALKFS